jgi:hypothetical protein
MREKLHLSQPATLLEIEDYCKEKLLKLEQEYNQLFKDFNSILIDREIPTQNFFRTTFAFDGDKIRPKLRELKYLFFQQQQVALLQAQKLVE